MYILVLKEALMSHMMDLWKSGASVKRKPICHQHTLKHTLKTLQEMCEVPNDVTGA